MMIGRLVKDAADQGYRPDCIVTASDVKYSPYPEMLWKNLIQLDVSDIKTVVK